MSILRWSLLTSCLHLFILTRLVAWQKLWEGLQRWASRVGVIPSDSVVVCKELSRVLNGCNPNSRVPAPQV